MSTGDPFADDPFADAPPPHTEASAPAEDEAAADEPEAFFQEDAVPAEAEVSEPVAAEPPAPEPTDEDLEPQATTGIPGEIPVVDREGAPVAPAAEEPQAPPEPPAPPPQAPPEPQEPAQEPPAAPPTPPASPDVPAAPAATASTAEANGTGATEAVPVPPAAQTAPEPGPNDPKKGHRHYVVLYQTGPDQFTKTNLQKKSGVDYVKRVTEKGEKEGDPDKVEFYLEARNNDHAYRLCFTLFGRPENGVTVLPLPKASWRPRRVAPAPPEPAKERLVIS